MKNVRAQLTEHDGVITPLLRGAPRLGLALGPALAKAGPGCNHGADNIGCVALIWQRLSWSVELSWWN